MASPATPAVVAPPGASASSHASARARHRFGGDAFNRFVSDRAAALGAIVLLLILLMALLANWIAPYDPAAQSLTSRRAAPGAAHLFGMDELGRDILSRIIYGSRDTLFSGAFAVLVGGLIGLPLGLLAGFYGRWIDGLIMRFIDAMLAFPAFLLAIVIVAVLGPSLWNAAFAIGIANVPMFARLVRGTVLGVRQNEYVTSAVAVGASDRRIMARHILPAVLAPVIVVATISLATAILSVAGLSFLGLGAQPPEPEWGAMLGSGRGFIREAPHITIAPGIAIMLLVLASNLVGDGLRDALDPQLKQR